MIEDLDVVALKRDRADLGLKAGDEGAVVLVYGDEACQVESSSIPTGPPGS